MGISPKTFVKLNRLELSHYYNIPEGYPIRCELCSSGNSGRLRALRYSGILWYYCPSCRFSGTALDYICKQEQIELLPLIYKLLKKEYLTDISDNEIRETILWDKYRKNIITKIHNIAGTPEGRFAPQGSQFLAHIDGLDQWSLARCCCTSDRKTIESIFFPRLEEGKHNTSPSRIFTGYGWDRISVIPLFDLPYHISGYFLINNCSRKQGREAVYHTVIKRLSPIHSNQSFFDVGCLSPRHLYQSGTGTENAAVILTDIPVLALELQCKLERQTGQPGNVIGWFPRNPKNQEYYENTWIFLEDVSKIFWCHPRNKDAIREAGLCDAQISIAFFTGNNVHSCTIPQDKLAAQIVREIQVTAVPWTRALTDYLYAYRNNLGTVLADLKLPQHVLEQYLRTAPNDLRQLIDSQFRTLSTTSRVVDNLLVEECTDGWWGLPKNGRGVRMQLSNIRCYIDKVINVAHHELIYQGRLRHKNREIAFTEPAPQFETNAVHKVSSLWIDSNPEEYPAINMTKDRFMRLIRTYSTMTMVNITKGVGWDYDKSLLRLPNILIGNGELFPGRVQINTLPFHVLHPDCFNPITKEDQQVAAVFVKELAKLSAVTAAMVAPLFSGAFRAEPPQTLMISGGDKPVQHLFDLLAVPCFSASQIKSAEQFARAHYCPFFTIHLPERKRQVNPFLPEVRDVYRRAFISTTLAAALSRMCYGEANLLVLPQVSFYEWSSRRLQQLMLKTILHCLLHLSKFILKQTVPTDCWNMSLIEETLQFIQNTLGITIPDRRVLFSGYTADGRYLLDFISLLRRTEHLSLTEAQDTADGLLVHCDALRTQFRSHVGYFDLNKLLEPLKGTDMLKESDSNGYLLFNRDAVTQSINRIETLYGPFIRSR